MFPNEVRGSAFLFRTTPGESYRFSALGGQRAPSHVEVVATGELIEVDLELAPIEGMGTLLVRHETTPYVRHAEDHAGGPREFFKVRFADSELSKLVHMYGLMRWGHDQHELELPAGDYVIDVRGLVHDDHYPRRFGWRREVVRITPGERSRFVLSSPPCGTLRIQVTIDESLPVPSFRWVDFLEGTEVRANVLTEDGQAVRVSFEGCDPANAAGTHSSPYPNLSPELVSKPIAAGAYLLRLEVADGRTAEVEDVVLESDKMTTVQIVFPPAPTPDD